MTPLLTFSCQRITSNCVGELANKAIALGGDGQRTRPDAKSRRNNAFGRSARRPLL